MWLKCSLCRKKLLFPYSWQFSLSSWQLELFSISLEGSNYRELTKQYTMLLLGNPRWRMLTSPLHRICDDFATNFSCSYQFIYLQALFNRKIHESRTYRTCRVLATNVVTLRRIGDCIRCNFMPWAWLDYYGVVAANTSEEIYDNDLEFASEEIFYRQKSWIVCSTRS